MFQQDQTEDNIKIVHLSLQVKKIKEKKRKKATRSKRSNLRPTHLRTPNSVQHLKKVNSVRWNRVLQVGGRMAQQQCEKVPCQVITVSYERTSNTASSSKHGECWGMPMGNLEQLSIIVWLHVIFFNYYKYSLCLMRIVFSKVYLSIFFKVNAGENRFFCISFTFKNIILFPFNTGG